MNAGWNVDKEKIKAALMEVVESRDPDLMIDAAKLLIDADKIDAKRESIAVQQQGDSENRRLQLLGLAKRIPIGELTKIASANGITLDASGSG